MQEFQPLILPVSDYKGVTCVRSSNYCLIAVSCPAEWSDALKHSLSRLSRLCLLMFNMLLMLSGDVESNPGPVSKVEADAFAVMLSVSTIQKLEEGHAALSEELSATIEELTASANEVARLTKRLKTLE